MVRNLVYQDVQVRGTVLEFGDRECRSRWEVINNFLERYRYEDISVLDFGANMGYFSFNTASQYPRAHVTMVDYEPLLPLLHQANGYPNTTLIHKYMDLEELEYFLAVNNCDVIFAMSVFHHFEEPERLIKLLLDSCDTVLFETPYPNENVDGVISGNRPYEYIKNIDPININSWIPHDRPICYKNDRECKFTGKVFSSSGLASSKTFPEIEDTIIRDLGTKYYPGTLNIELEMDINLINHFYLSGVYRIYPAYLFGLPVNLIHPEIAGMPTNHLEIMSPYCLRDKFNIREGDEVVLSIDKKYLSMEKV